MTTTIETEHPVIIHYPHLVYRNKVLATAATTPILVDTFGWDTVYAIKFEDVNKAIVKKGSSPKTFSVSDTTTDPVTANGNFGDWQVSPGGDGHLLFMSVPIKTGKMSWKGTDYPMDDTKATIEIQLDYIPNPDQTQNLKVKTSSGQPVVNVEGITFPQGKEPSFMPKALMVGLLQKWFNDNLQEFNHVFSVVAINQIADKGDFQWLKPREVGYANSNEILGILATTGDRKKTGLPYQISPYAIPKGAPSGFVISGERTLMEMILPGMPAVFPGSKTTDYELVNSTTLRNKNEIKIPVPTDSHTYTGVIAPQGFTLAIEGGVLHINMPKMTVNISPGIDAEIDLNEWVKMTIQEKSDGTTTLKFEQSSDHPSTINHQINLSEGVKITVIVLSIVAGILLSVLGVAGSGKLVADGMSKITARVVMAIVVGLVGAVVSVILTIPEFISLANEKQFDKLPSLETFIANGILTVSWPGSTGFKVVSAGLNGSTQIGIDPLFVH